MNAALQAAGITAVAIHESSVFGVLAYHAQCLTCGWRCHSEPHSREATAVRHAEGHTC